MTESDIQTELLNFLRYKRPPQNFVCELKLVKSEKQSNFRFSQIEDHQWDSIFKKHGHEFAYKIIDPSVSVDGKVRTSRRPLDFVYMCNPDRFFGICFFIPRRKKIVYFIDGKSMQYAKTKHRMLSEAVIELNSTFAIDLKNKKIIRYNT